MRYEPIAQIGRGGMAEVLLARVHAVGGVRRLAVLKRIWPELATDPDFVTMFLDEARLSLRLAHPNVVQTYEVITGGGELAIAMEYLDGQPLTRVLNRLLRGSGDLSLSLRLRILAHVLAGLEHAHTLTDVDGSPMGVVHRDVSPQNVFITYDGQVKLVDFGVAKTLAASHNTRPGTLKGKLAYMAPEQLQRVEIDRRADLFSVGVMLWEMLAARRMWHRMTEVEIVSHLAAGLPLPPLPPDAGRPPYLEAICARALDPDPTCRYATAAEMEMDIESVLVGTADSHIRNLGNVVSHAFATERAERQAVIESWARPSAPVLSIVPELPTPPPEEVTPRRWTAPVDILSHIPPDVPAVDIDLSGLVSGPISAPDPDRAPGWLRFAMGALTLAAVVLGSLYIGGWRYPLLDGREEDVSAPAPQSDTPTRAPVAAGVQGAQRGPGAPSVAAKAIPDEPARHRRHHRRSSADGEGSVEKDTDVEDSDGVLPLSDDESSAQ
jgi:serine/threonine-protein kinase